MLNAEPILQMEAAGVSTPTQRSSDLDRCPDPSRQIILVDPVTRMLEMPAEQ
jgi:hypothetical protein